MKCLISLPVYRGVPLHEVIEKVLENNFFTTGKFSCLLLIPVLKHLSVNKGVTAAVTNHAF